MNIRRQTLVAALGLALASSPLMARTQLDEQDSVFSWGRWKVLAPAAGGNILPSPLFVVKDLNAGDADPLTPRIIEPNGDTGGNGGDGEQPGPGPLVGPCDFGIGCGFTSFDADKNRPGSAADTGSFDIDFRREQDGEGGYYAAVVSLFTVGEVDYEATNDDGSLRVVRSGVGVDYLPAREGERFLAMDRSIGGSVFPDADNADYSAGFWNEDGHSGLFVWGMPTDEATLSSLAAGDVVATYSGHIGASAAGGVANLTIDFGASSWSGSFATPDVNFTASGGFDGPSFVSTSLGGDAVDGFVEGAVVGSNAERAIGRFEIVDGAGVDHRDIFNTIRTDGLD